MTHRRRQDGRDNADDDNDGKQFDEGEGPGEATRDEGRGTKRRTHRNIFPHWALDTRDSTLVFHTLLPTEHIILVDVFIRGLLRVGLLSGPSDQTIAPPRYS